MYPTAYGMCRVIVLLRTNLRWCITHPLSLFTYCLKLMLLFCDVLIAIVVALLCSLSCITLILSPLQGLDVLEIMRNIHVFVSRYLYNLNNQVRDLWPQFTNKSLKILRSLKRKDMSPATLLNCFFEWELELIFPNSIAALGLDTGILNVLKLTLS